MTISKALLFYFSCSVETNRISKLLSYTYVNKLGRCPFLTKLSIVGKRLCENGTAVYSTVKLGLLCDRISELYFPVSSREVHN